MEGLAAYFEELDDPRSGNAGLHELIEIMVIALCTVLCGDAQSPRSSSTRSHARLPASVHRRKCAAEARKGFAMN